MFSREEEARELARKHYQIEEGMTQIYRVMGPGDDLGSATEPIKLLEVNRNTVPSGVMPLRFGPALKSDIHFPSVIIEVTPDEYQKIESLELTLPHGWTKGEFIPRPTSRGEGA